MLNNPSNKILGFIFGLILCVSQINLMVGFPLLLIFTLLLSSNFRLEKQLINFTFLILFQILWMFIIWFFFSAQDFFWISRQISPFILMLTFTCFRFNESFIKSFSIPLIFLCFLDLYWNLSVYAFGLNPSGHGGAMRAGDILIRLGGIFNNPFFSINIALVGIFCGLILKNRVVIFMAMANLLINGTFKAPILAITLLIAWLIVKLNFNSKAILCTSFLFVGCIFGLTFYFSGGDDYPGNTLRVSAWLNSLENIYTNPLIGRHDFLVGDSKTTISSLEEIKNYGVAESSYLQLANDFGVIASIVYCSILYKLFSYSYQRFKKNESKSYGFERLALIIAIVIFTDSFYGTFFGSSFTSAFSLMLIFYVNNEKPTYI